MFGSLFETQCRSNGHCGLGGRATSAWDWNISPSAQETWQRENWWNVSTVHHSV